MLTPKIRAIMAESQEQGWILEPQAKQIFSSVGLTVPAFASVRTDQEAVRFAEKIGYPVVAKIVSPQVLHKSDVGGVVTAIDSEDNLKNVLARFRRMEGFVGMLIEEMVAGGIELIVGAKTDYQFGPVILLGMGGTAVEIYRDITLKMAPLNPSNVESMLKNLKAYKLLTGYRGKAPVNLDELRRLLITFSEVVMDMAEKIESIDLNPVICTATQCVIADARILLKKDPHP